MIKIRAPQDLLVRAVWLRLTISSPKYRMVVFRLLLPSPNLYKKRHFHMKMIIIVIASTMNNFCLS